MTKNQDYEDDTSRQFDDEDYEGVFFCNKGHSI